MMPAKAKKVDRTPVIFAIGAVILIIGFILLSLADQRAQNIFGLLGPLSIVGGLITIAASFLF